MKRNNRYFQQTMEKLSSEKEESIQKLIRLSLEQLENKKKEFYSHYKGADECGFTEAAEVNWLKFSIIKEAIKVKNGNEEQLGDDLS